MAISLSSSHLTGRDLARSWEFCIAGYRSPTPDSDLVQCVQHPTSASRRAARAMSRIFLSSPNLLSLRVALGHAISANPEATRDFPFSPESSEKLASLLDSLLLRAAPGTSFALEEAPNHQPYDAATDPSLQLSDKTRQDFGVTRVGSGDLVSIYTSLRGFQISPSHFRSMIPVRHAGALLVPSAAQACALAAH